MDSHQRLHDKVMNYAETQIHSILLGVGEAQYHHDQLLRMLNGFVHCAIISNTEAELIRGDAKMALDNSFHAATALNLYPSDKPDRRQV